MNIKELANAKKTYAKAWVAYDNGEPIMTDREFDALERDIQKADPTWSRLQKTGLTQRKQKTELEFFAPSLSKIYPEKSDVWLSKNKGKMLVLDKLDGSSIQVAYNERRPVRVVTRGDGQTGQDISFLIPYLSLPRIEHKGYHVFRCEAVMEKQVFARKYSKLYENPRNLVAGILNRVLKAGEKPDAAIKDVSIVVLGVYGRQIEEGLEFAQIQGLEVPHTVTVKNPSTETLIGLLKKRNHEGPFEIDGLVLIRPDQEFSYESNERPKWTTAFKVNDDEASEIAVVKDVIWQTSYTKVITPKVEIRPVELNGVTIKFCTAHNAKWLVDRGIGPGAKVRIVRSGGVIPKIVEVIKPAKALKLPQSLYRVVGVNYVALVEDRVVATKRIARFLAINGVENIALKTVDSLFTATAGKSISMCSIVGWTRVALMEGPKQATYLRHYGVGPKNTQIFGTELSKLRKLDIVNSMIGSTAFDLLGEKRLRMIQKKASLLELVSLQMKRKPIPSLVLKGFGDITWNQFTKGLAKYASLHRKLLKLGVEFTESTVQAKIAKTGKWSGHFGTWTGYRSPEEVEAFESNGGMVIPFGTKTTVLFYKEGGKSSTKVEKAGDKALTWEQFINKYK